MKQCASKKSGSDRLETDGLDRSERVLGELSFFVLTYREGVGRILVAGARKRNLKASGTTLKGVNGMATRESVENLIQKCEDTIQFAQEQFKESSLQQQYNNDDYTKALQGLEETYTDITEMALSANSQQREQLHRKRLQLQQLQNTMILEGQGRRTF